MKTNINIGLNNNEVNESREKNGINKLTKKNKTTFLKLLIESLNDPIIKILMIALGIKIIFLFKESNIYETIGIVAAILMASLVSTLSEYGSEKAFEKLNEENSLITCKVLRNSKRLEINIEEIVVGDIVYIESGDKVPADGELVNGEVSVDESSLTGETKEKNKTIYKDKVLYKGSIITSKAGVMNITSVGDKTFYGQIAKEIQDSSPETPLKSRLRKLAKIISMCGYIAAILVFVAYMFNVLVIKNSFDIDKIIYSITNFDILFPHLIYALTLTVAVIVMAVPEGLPMMITLVLSSNMKRMLKRNVLVRKLVGIETAGSLNILFTDKTGTLTEGKLKVVGLMKPNLSIIEDKNDMNSSEKYYDLLKTSLVYNNASIMVENNNIIGGNTTDRSILEYMGFNDKTKYKVLDEIIFDSKNKYSSVTLDYDREMTFVKGAYEKILNLCEFYYNEKGEKKRLDDKVRYTKKLQEKMEEGNRILAIATSITKELNHLTLLGFILIKDTIRKEAYKGISQIKNAGINVVMLTGDAKETAIAVARDLKIIEESNDIILTSEELNNMSDENIKRMLPNLKVVARSLPQDKNRLVRLSQELDLVVGMTGDGVNDAPALKKADVGFAMGSGTEVAKEVSDIIIIDNNILSISQAILFGRTIFKSIRKFVVFQLTVNFNAVGLSILGPFIGVLAPVTVVQMLWINMIMDTLAGLAFAFEAPLDEYMEESPKRKDEPIMNRYMVNQILFNSTFSSLVCIWFLKSEIIYNIFRIDVNNKYLYTAFFGLFIFLAIFNSFNARTHRINIFSNILKNKVFIIVILFIVLVQLFLIYFGGAIFRTTGLTLIEFETMIIIAFSIIPFDIMRKLILRKKGYPRGV